MPERQRKEKAQHFDLTAGLLRATKIAFDTSSLEQKARNAMLDPKWLRVNLEEAGRRLATRGEEASLNAFQGLDAKRRGLLREAEDLKEMRNHVSEEIGRMKKEGKDASGRIEEMGLICAAVAAALLAAATNVASPAAALLGGL